MPPPPPLSALLPLLVVTALLGATGAAGYRPARYGGSRCYSEHTCRAVCRYGNAYLKERCKQCHPEICQGESDCRWPENCRLLNTFFASLRNA